MKVLTFEPLSRNRYRALGTGQLKAPIVKKAQIASVRAYYANQDRKPLPRLVPKMKTVEVFDLLPDYVSCPECRRSDWHTKVGPAQCYFCKARFTIKSFIS